MPGPIASWLEAVITQERPGASALTSSLPLLGGKPAKLVSQSHEPTRLLIRSLARPLSSTGPGSAAATRNRPASGKSRRVFMADSGVRLGAGDLRRQRFMPRAAGILRGPV